MFFSTNNGRQKWKNEKALVFGLHSAPTNGKSSTNANLRVILYARVDT